MQVGAEGAVPDCKGMSEGMGGRGGGVREGAWV